MNEITSNKPIMETSVKLSKDGRFIIHKTTITDIKPVTYFKKVIGGDPL